MAKKQRKGRSYPPGVIDIGRLTYRGAAVVLIEHLHCGGVRVVPGPAYYSPAGREAAAAELRRQIPDVCRTHDAAYEWLFPEPIPEAVA
jgi:hypothetical protein